MPDPSAFGHALRENMITGEVLLTDVDKETLRDDLGLKALGHRSSILQAIRYLRQSSLKYQQSHANSSFPLDGRHSVYATPRPGQYLSSPSHDPSSRAGTPQRGPSFIPAPGPESLEAAHSASFLPSNHSQINRSHSPSGALDPENAATESSNSSRTEKRVASDSGAQIRSGEHHVVDSQGRKCRKLELRPPGETQGRDANTVPKPNLSPNKAWYLGPNSIASAELFYPLDTDDDSESFIIASPRFPTGQCRFVNKSLKYFYQQRPIRLNGRSQNQWALIPYKSANIPKGRSRYFTLYTSENGRVTSSKQNMDNFPQLNGLQALIPEPDPLDFILQRYPVEEDDRNAIPLYGDSGSEGTYDEETWQEILDEREDPASRKPTKLTPADVDSIMEGSIAKFESKWHHDHRPREEPKAWRLWRTAKKNKCTNHEINVFTHEIGRLENRLRKIQDAIRESEYVSKAELESQCQSMEQTVFNIQALKWRVSVLEQVDCPPKVAAVARKPRQAAKPRTDADEESLYSESDGFIEEDISSDEQLQMHLDDGPEIDQQRRASNAASTLSDDDVVLPSRVKRQRTQRASGAVAQGVGSSLPAVIESARAPECIDLTQDSPAPDPSALDLPAPEDLTIETPPLNPVDPPCKSGRMNSVSPVSDLDSDGVIEIPNEKQPQDAQTAKHLEDFRSASCDELEERQDRRKLLSKLISSLSDDERKNLAESIPGYDADDLRMLVKEALKTILGKSESVRSMEDDKKEILMRTASLFISWVHCARMQPQGIPRSLVLGAIRDIKGFSAFFNEICLRLQTPKQKVQDPLPEGMPDSNTQRDPSTPHKKRKRAVKESKDAKRNQENAKRRAEVQDKERKALERKMTRMGLSNDDPTRQAVCFGNPVIYLDPHIGQRVKPHQLKGVQFMWRELIENERQEGCLLAHTMGLGKTMQVVSLLVTMSAAATSSDDRIRQQVPENLRRSQTLIVCPSSLIENWYEEFLLWSPKENSLGPIRKITSAVTLQERLEEAYDWNEDGGILILSYDMFRALIANKETKAKPSALNDDDHRKIKRCLLNGPNVIVADEAHKMKNPSSGIAGAAKQFKSKSRIALTGSPLANNLVDYFTMVDWIAPGYLGQFVSFKANFVEPIEEGLYVDSTASEKRKSVVKLQVLKQILDPKIDRADISVLEGSLQSKVEFVITVPLTDLQRAAYNSYVESAYQGTEDVVNTKLWSWLAILGLCCNHPTCFRDKLKSRANEKTKAAKEEVVPGDESIAQALLPEGLFSKEEELFATVPDMKALNLSYRAQILNKIVTLSIEAGDKVLIFSHSIPTLSYIEHVLQVSKHSYCRLDGKTPMQGRQAATKKFNTGSEHQVYLISTRAGGLGLNIPGANRVIIFDFNFNPIWEEQAVGRAYRIGQQKPVFVYRFIAGGTFEEVIYNKAVFKTQLAFRVVDKKSPIRYASKSLGEYLFPVKPVEKTDVSEYIGKDPRVLDEIIKEHDGSIRKIQLTETFQREDNYKMSEEDRKDVQTQLSDEILRRDDPVAYGKLMWERQKQLLPSPNPFWQATGGPHVLQGPVAAGMTLPLSIGLPQGPTTDLGMPHRAEFPLRRDNLGPRPLVPDDSLIRPLNWVDHAPPPSPFPTPISHPGAARSDKDLRPSQAQASPRPSRPSRERDYPSSSKALVQKDPDNDSNSQEEKTNGNPPMTDARIQAALGKRSACNTQ